MGAPPSPKEFWAIARVHMQTAQHQHLTPIRPIYSVSRCELFAMDSAGLVKEEMRPHDLVVIVGCVPACSAVPGATDSFRFSIAWNSLTSKYPLPSLSSTLSNTFAMIDFRPAQKENGLVSGLEDHRYLSVTEDGREDASGQASNKCKAVETQWYAKGRC